MLDIIGTVLNIIMIGLTIYQLFFKKITDDVNQCIQVNLIKQINPRYNVQLSYEVMKNNSIALKNAQWKAKRIFQVIVYLIYIFLGVYLIDYIKNNTITTMTDTMAVVCLPFRRMLIYLSSFLIIFCIIVILRGWEKNKSVLYNLVGMKFFSLKIFTDFILLLGLFLVSYSFLEKMSVSEWNSVCSWIMVGLAIQLSLQLMWIHFTISKLTKSIQTAQTYEEKEKQLLMYVPVYVFSVLFTIMTVYIKFS